MFGILMTFVIEIATYFKIVSPQLNTPTVTGKRSKKIRIPDIDIDLNSRITLRTQKMTEPPTPRPQV
jgi:hypothetical protein